MNCPKHSLLRRYRAYSAGFLVISIGLYLASLSLAILKWKNCSFYILLFSLSGLGFAAVSFVFTVLATRLQWEIFFEEIRHE